MSITVEQCRAARALLGWSANDLAKEAELGIATVKRYESGQPVQSGSINAILAALESGGVQFIAVGQRSPSGGAGVRLSPK